MRVTNAFRLYSFGLFFVGLCVAALWARNIRSENEDRLSRRFDALSARTVNQLTERLHAYEHGLLAVRGLVAATGIGSITYAQFVSYSGSRNYGREFPGSRGFGVIQRIPAAKEAAFVAAMRHDGRPDFTITQFAPHDGERDVIRYIEPVESNREAVGLDIASEASRRKAAQTSMNTGQPALTGPITLVQATGKKGEGFLFMLPFYREYTRGGKGQGDVQGWIYTPLIIDEVLADLIQDNGEYAIVLSDETSPDQREVFYASQMAGNPATNGLSKRLSFEMYGRKWAMEIKAQPMFVKYVSMNSPLMTAELIALISALLSALLYVVLTGNLRRQQSDMASQIIDATPDGMLVVDGKGRIVRVNDKLAAQTGYDKDELIGKTVEFLIPERLRQAHEQLRPLYDGEPRPMGKGREMYARRKDGSEFSIEINLGSVDFGGQRHVIATMTDITDRKKAQEELNRYKQMIEFSSDPAYMIDIDDNYRLAYVNQAAIDHWGAPREELLTWHLPDWDPHFQEGSDQLHGLLDWVKAHPGQSIETIHRLKNGEIVPVEVTTSYLDVGGHPYTFGYIKNITDRKRTEEQLRTSKEEAEKASRAKSVFLSSMSHELRTPMNAILGYSQLLTMPGSMSTLNENERQGLVEIHNAGQHLLRLINEILDLAKIESGSMPLSIEPVAAHDILRPSLTMARSMAQRYNVSIEDMTGNRVLPSVLADPTRTKQCLLNYLSNAVKYNRPGGSVYLECEITDDGFLRFIVQDTGCGIPEKDQPQLFQAFQRFGHQNGPIEGTGIGLVITKELVERMNGRVGFESEVGKGSTFWLDLPISAAT